MYRCILVGGGLLRERSGVEMTEVEARMVTCSLFVCAAGNYQQKAAERLYKFRSQLWLKSLQVRSMHKRHL